MNHIHFDFSASHPTIANLQCPSAVSGVLCCKRKHPFQSPCLQPSCNSPPVSLHEKHSIENPLQKSSGRGGLYFGMHPAPSTVVLRVRHAVSCNPEANVYYGAVGRGSFFSTFVLLLSALIALLPAGSTSRASQPDRNSTWLPLIVRISLVFVGCTSECPELWDVLVSRLGHSEIRC